MTRKFYFVSVIFFITVFSSLFFTAQIAKAYENYAECEILKQKMKENFSELSLDEPFLRTEKRFGFTQQPYENGSIELIKIHPDLSDEIYENFDGANLNNEWLKSVNGIPIDQISEASEENIYSGDTIVIETDGYEHKFVLKKKEYSSILIDDVVLHVDDVSEIDTKTFSFDTNFKTTLTWRDGQQSQ